ncbi:hypothetical protein AOG1_08110 [Geobacter sp. AOG1]|nr:hypothetical protein AOG1_08110 [Geobacter sp. AOG1]
MRIREHRTVPQNISQEKGFFFSTATPFLMLRRLNGDFMKNYDYKAPRVISMRINGSIFDFGQTVPERIALDSPHHHTMGRITMKRIYGVMPAIIAILLTVPATQSLAFQCNECHSKNPAMVRMHEALRGRGCFDCHKVGQKLMGKGQPTDRDSLLTRRSSDPLCVECHKK